MGFGSIVATGITVIILIAAGYIILAGLAYCVDSANAAQAAVRASAEERMHTSLTLSGFEQLDDHSLQFNVTNTGDTEIDDVTQLDVLIKPVSLGAADRCIYLPFADDAGHEVPDHWYIAGQVGTAVGDTFQLETGGSMTVRCEFADRVPDRPVGYLEVAAPDGVQAYLSYQY